VLDGASLTDRFPGDFGRLSSIAGDGTTVQAHRVVTRSKGSAVVVSDAVADEWFSRLCRRGHVWERSSATVFAALDTLRARGHLTEEEPTVLIATSHLFKGFQAIALPHSVPPNASAVVLSDIPLTTRTTGPGGTPPAPRTRPADHPFFTVSSLPQNQSTHELHTPILGTCEQFISSMKSRSPISGCSGLFQPLNKCSHVRYVELHSSGCDHLSGNPWGPWLKTIT
jgi:hypothetical protein